MPKKHWLIIGIIVVVLLVFSVLQSLSGFMGRRMVEKAMERASDDKADVDMNADGTMNIKTEDGEFSTGNTIPKDWPTDVPAYAAATVSYSAFTNPADGKTEMALILTTKDTAANVKAFYETSLADNGWTITNTMQGGGTVIMTAEKDGRQLSLAIAEADGKTSITIGVEQ